MTGRVGRLRARAASPAIRSSIAEFFVFGVSSAAYQGSRLALSLFAAALLVAEDYADWGLALAVFALSSSATLGALSGANRSIPIALGRDDHDGARRIENVGTGAAWVAAGLLVAGTVGGAVLARAGDWALVVIVGTVAAAQQLYLAAQVTLRARLEFGRASLQQAWMAVVFLITGVPLLVAAGAAGLVVAQGLVYVSAAGLVWLLWHRSVRPVIAFPAIVALAREGLSITLAAVVFTLLTTADRWVVLAAAGQRELGIYSFAALVASIVPFVTLLLGQLAYPRLARSYGRRGPGRHLLVMAAQQSGLAVAAGLLATIVLAIAAEFVIRPALPAYAEAAPVMPALSLAYTALAGGSGFANLLIATGRGVVYLAVVCVACAALVAGAVAALEAGLGALGVAGAALVAYAGSSAALAVVAIVSELRRPVPA